MNRHTVGPSETLLLRTQFNYYMAPRSGATESPRHSDRVQQRGVEMQIFRGLEGEIRIPSSAKPQILSVERGGTDGRAPPARPRSDLFFDHFGSVLDRARSKTSRVSEA